MSSVFSETKEFHDLRYEFEKTFKHRCLDREQKQSFRLGAFYEHGEVNELFKAFMHGYQIGRTQ